MIEVNFRRGMACLAVTLAATGSSLATNEALAQEDPTVVDGALEDFRRIVSESTNNTSVISLANRISAVCPELTVQFDPNFDPNNPDFDPSVEAGAASGTDEGDLVGRCTGAILTTLEDADAGLDILTQLAGEETLGLETAISGINRSQTQAIAARIAAFSSGSPARLVVARRKGPVILASNSYAMPYQDNGVASDASNMAGAYADETDLGLGWSGYLNGSFSFGDQNPTELEAGFDFDSYSLTAGADRALGERLMLGAALNYGSTSVDFAGGAGDTETNLFSVSAYGATRLTDNLSASLLGSYGIVEHEATRRIRYNDGFSTIDRTARGETDGSQIEFTGTTEYTRQFDALSIGPTARLSYVKLETDGYAETGADGLNLVYEDQDSTSLTSGLGIAAYYAISTARGIISPYARLEWEHEFDDDARTFAVRYVADTFGNQLSQAPSVINTNDPDRDRARLGFGVASQFARGISGFADYQSVIGFDDVTASTIAVGLRMEF